MKRLSLSYFKQEIHIFESDEYISNKIADSSEVFIQRKIFFPRPLVVYKIKFDEIIGENTLHMNVEFLGIDRETKQNQFHPFNGNGGKIFKRGVEWPDNNDVTIADRQFIDSQGDKKKWLQSIWTSHEILD